MENKNIIKEFSKRKKRQILVTIIALIAVLILFSFELDSVSVFVVLGILIFTWTNWKCPSCNKYLGKGGNPKCCPNCGVQLVEKK